MSRRKDMGAKLKDSMSAEDEALESRFKQADVALSGRDHKQRSGKKRRAERAPAPAQPRVIRDTFSMPEADHQLIQELRTQLIQEGGVVLNKSEVLRAGLHALQKMSSAQRLAAARSVDSLKPGRKAS